MDSGSETALSRGMQLDSNKKESQRSGAVCSGDVDLEDEVRCCMSSAVYLLRGIVAVE